MDGIIKIQGYLEGGTLIVAEIENRKKEKRYFFQIQYDEKDGDPESISTIDIDQDGLKSLHSWIGNILKSPVEEHKFYANLHNIGED